MLTATLLTGVVVYWAATNLFPLAEEEIDSPAINPVAWTLRAFGAVFCVFLCGLFFIVF
jgi:hypothetical protein